MLGNNSPGTTYTVSVDVYCVNCAVWSPVHGVHFAGFAGDLTLPFWLRFERHVCPRCHRRMRVYAPRSAHPGVVPEFAPGDRVCFWRTGSPVRPGNLPVYLYWRDVRGARVLLVWWVPREGSWRYLIQTRITSLSPWHTTRCFWEHQLCPVQVPGDPDMVVFDVPGRE